MGIASVPQAAAPFTPIKDNAHYEEVLTLIESLSEEAEGSPGDPHNVVIELLGRAIETFEKRNKALAALKRRARNPQIWPWCVTRWWPSSKAGD